MAQCSCGATVRAERLVRHDYPHLSVVHCPECNAVLGSYRRHGDAPKTDHLRQHT